MKSATLALALVATALTLPAVIAHVRPNGSIAPTRLLAALVRRPSTIVSLARLGGRSREGSSRLAEAMGDWLRLD